MAVAALLAAQILVGIIAYAAWENRNSDYQYAQGQLDTLNDPKVVDTRHIDENQSQRIEDEEHVSTVNALTDERTIPNIDE